MSLTTTRPTLRRPEAEDWDAFRDYFTSDRSVPLGGPNSVGLSWRIFALHLGHWLVRALAERLGAVADPGAAYPASFAEPHLVYRHRGGRA